MAEITKVKPGTLTDFGNGFYHIRGSFKLGGVVDLGTHCALVELPDGRFVFLDSYTLDDDLKAKVDALTDGGKKVAAIINVHPFHTLHIEWMAKTYPHAKLYGTRRHHEKFPQLPWESEQCEAGALDGLFGEALTFSIPEGVQMVCEDENVHFSSAQQDDLRRRHTVVHQGALPALAAALHRQAGVPPDAGQGAGTQPLRRRRISRMGDRHGAGLGGCPPPRHRTQHHGRFRSGRVSRKGRCGARPGGRHVAEASGPACAQLGRSARLPTEFVDGSRRFAPSAMVLLRAHSK